jgi:hypothetical protein
MGTEPQKPEQKDLKTTELIKRLKRKQTTNYHMETHVALLAKVMNSYGGVGNFCDEAVISKPTFYAWLEAHPEFKEAYEILLNRGESMWEKLPLTRPDLPMSYWQTIWRNRFNQGRRRLQKPEKEGIRAELEALDNQLYDGHLNLDEHLKGVSSLEKKAKVQLLANEVTRILGTEESERIKRMSAEELGQELTKHIYDMIAPRYKIVENDPSDES